MLTKLTKEQGAILSAYTGYLCCSFSDLHEYAERILCRPVFTHEFALDSLVKELKEASKEDFLSIIPEKN